MWATEEGLVFLRYSWEWVCCCIMRRVAQAIHCCYDAGCQGAPGFGRVTFHIPNSSGPTSRGDFFGQWLIVRYPSFQQTFKWFGIMCFSGRVWYRACHYLLQGFYHQELLFPNIKDRRQGCFFIILDRFSIAWWVALAEEEPGTVQLCGKHLVVFATILERDYGTYTV